MILPSSSSILNIVFSTYLQQNGWKTIYESHKDRHFRVWRFSDIEKQHEISVPVNLDRISIQELIHDLAKIESKTELEVYKKILDVLCHQSVVQNLNLVKYPNPILRAKCLEINEFNDYIRSVADRMIQIMKEENGMGLAAPQIGLPIRLFVINEPNSLKPPLVFANPKITYRNGTQSIEEKCLSIPNFSKTIPRSKQIVVDAQDENGRLLGAKLNDLWAICVQHEIDHLNGILITDY